MVYVVDVDEWVGFDSPLLSEGWGEWVLIFTITPPNTQTAAPIHILPAY